MADILCNWLNNEVKISRTIDPDSVAKEFSSGYLIGELLRKYELQEDFGKFSNSSSTNAKLSNFTKLEPTLRLLEIPFDTVRAKEIMTEKQGVAIKILYELFVALENKRKSQLTGTAMETMRPKAPKVKEEMNREYYQNRLKQINPRQSEMQLDQLIDRWRQHRERLEESDLRSRMEEEERLRQEQQRKRHQAHQRSKKRQQELNDQVARILAAKVHIPKPPADKTLAGIKARQQKIRNQETQNTQKSLVEFEARLKAMQPVTSEGGDNKKLDDELLAYIKEEAMNPNRARPTEDPEYIKPRSNGKYIRKIQQRTREDEEAKVEREKRRRKVLVDQLKAHEAQEDARREEEIVNRLMRQSQVERRIVVQLLQTRQEKAVILENRKLREQQYQERRRKEFEDALNVEAEMAKLARERYASELDEAKREHKRIMDERRRQQYEKHYTICHKVTLDIVDYACKFGEYRELTGGLVPHKLFREWTAMFLNEVAIYPDIEEETVEDWLEKEREQLLNEGDFTEYKLMYGEWALPDQTSLAKPKDNKVLGYIVHRLFELVYPPPLPPPAPVFQEFPIKIGIVGKAFSGKSTIIQSMCQRYGFAHILVSRLVVESVEAYKLGEVETLPTPPPTVEQLRGLLETEEMQKKDPLEIQAGGDLNLQDLPGGGTSVQTSGGGGGDGASTSLISWQAKKPQLSRRAACGKRIFDELCKGRNVPDDVIAELVVDAVRQVPEGQGWVLDDFPLNLEQAQHFEKFLTGFEDKANPVEEEKSTKKPRKPELVNNPNPPPEAAAPESGIDLLLLLDITDDEALKRSEGRTVAPVKSIEYHQEYKPPPDGAATGLSGQEKVEAVKDDNYDREQIQKRLVGFEDSWAQIESWYHKFNVVYSVDGNKEREEVFYDVDRLVQEIFRKPRLFRRSQKIDLKKHPPPPTPPPQPESELGGGGSGANLDGADGQLPEGGNETVIVDTIAPEPTEAQPSTPAGSDKDTAAEPDSKKASRKGKKSPRGSASPKGRGASQKTGKGGKGGDREGSVGSEGGKSRGGSPKSKRGRKTGVSSKMAVILQDPDSAAVPPPAAPGTSMSTNAPNKTGAKALQQSLGKTTLAKAGLNTASQAGGPANPTNAAALAAAANSVSSRAASQVTAGGGANAPGGTNNAPPNAGATGGMGGLGDKSTVASTGQTTSSNNTMGKKGSDSKRSASGKGKGKGTKRSPSPAEVPVPQPAPPAGDGETAGAPEPPPPAQPGDDDWECVKEPVDLEVAEILAPQWEFIEDTYVKGLQVTFKNIRESRELSILYLHQVREDFKTYLMRPDEKQAHVSQLQEEFNLVPDDVRNDEEIKSEWHTKVFALQELLWDISDKRKQSAEAERKMIMSDGWLPDRLGVLTNDYITLMQIELDKFYDTLKVLKDYYKSMDGSKVPTEGEEGGGANARLPLLEIQAQDATQTNNLSSSNSKTASAKKSQGSERVKSAKHEDNAEDGEKPKIPLVPRRPASADFAPQGITQPKKEAKKAGGADLSKKKGGAGGAAGAGGDMHAETPVPPNDEDEKILYDAANYVFQHLQALMAAEQAAKEAEEEAERLAMLEREKEKEKQAKAKEKGGKKGGKGSAGPKKGGAPNVGKDSAIPGGGGSREGGVDGGAASPTQDEIMAEEMAKKAVKDKIRQEYIGALTMEEQALRVRVELIKMKAMTVIQDVKAKAEDAYCHMDEWLGGRFRQEMAAIDRVCEAMEYCIEEGLRMQEELILEQEQFHFHEDRIAFRDDSPQPRPDPEEIGDSVHFTVGQLKSLLNQFALSAPSGQISAKGFIDIMSDLDALTQGQETLPDVWVSLSNDKLTEIANNVTPNTEYVDWRKFLLALSKPWIHPTQTQLLELLTAYKSEDEGATGFIDRDTYDRVPLWFKDDSRAPTPEDPEEPFPFARCAALKAFFFALFGEADEETPAEEAGNNDPVALDYVRMLLYFSSDPEPVEGFLRALSVSAQTHIPRLTEPPDAKTPKTANIVTQRSEVSVTSELPPANEVVMMESGLSIAQSGAGASETGQGDSAAHQPNTATLVVPPIDIPDSAIDAEVGLESFLLVLQHGQTTQGDSNRFAAGADAEEEDLISVKKLEEIWAELGGGGGGVEQMGGPVKFTALSQHPHIQDIIAACYTYKFPDLSVATSVDE
ncbi:sperm flagellar protein 2-like isoform X3 [Symsagittifera roscoffensis]|uniref:sperm flagellar protein 2-like isoform X3 n=1 Tax=Symsagittifera roscoffensis TaxID=84072 RepID=UPI00307BE865